MPRAIAPELIKHVKQTAKQENKLLINAKTISPAWHAAQAITNTSQLLISNSIGNALDTFLYEFDLAPTL